MPISAQRYLRLFYPSQINLYLQCPERFHLKYVKREKISEDFSPALAKGIAVHDVLAACNREYQATRSLPIDLRQRVQARLPQYNYSTDVAWQYEVEDALRQVRFALSCLDGKANVVAVESTYRWAYGGDDSCPAFTLAAKVDLVLECHDKEGRKYLDAIDFKTGGGLRVDPVQNVAVRLVVQKSLGQGYDRIVTSTAFLGEEKVRSEVIDVETCRGTWKDIKKAVADIHSEQHWSPSPSPLCEWCPFRENGCSLDHDDGNENLATWLDGAA